VERTPRSGSFDPEALDGKAEVRQAEESLEGILSAFLPRLLASSAFV